jgi:hypothetical protein
MHFHFIDIGGLPEPIRNMLAEHGDDGDLRQVRHELLKREEARFWNSLDREQLRWLNKIFQMIDDSDEPEKQIGRQLGQATAYMEQRFKSCVCGETHRDPDDLLEQLVNKTREASAEDAELEQLNLARVPESPFVNPNHVGKYHCRKCSVIFDSLDDRKKASIGDTHEGCVDS